ncbi:hypothetical protein ZWY2020_044808 [Hordeum vulgare]|nr:hypothetical protein ZWY2020_044808 [Hordeum vulgare]
MASRPLLLPCSLVAVLVLALAAGSEARDHVVGGGANGAWKVPPPAQHEALNEWAQKTRFHVGDNLVFKFDAAADSVLEVTRADYDRCNTASPIATYKASAATVPLPPKGERFRHFISGAPGNCQKGERVIVLVMSENHGRRVVPPAAPAPAHSPSSSSEGLVEAPAHAPAPAPTTGAAWRTASGGGSVVLGALLGALLVVGF